MTAPGGARLRKGILWGLQAAVALVVGVLVWRQVAHHWDEYRALHVSLAPRAGWLALSVLAIFLTYGIQVESWRRLLAGWGQHLGFGQAGRIWLLANLGRYVPGKVWSVAGMMVMARQAGVAPWASAASAVAIQAIGIGMATILVIVSVPGATSPLQVALASAAALATVAALTWDRPVRLLGRIAGLQEDIRPLPVRALLRGASLTLASWITYGAAFWLLARGLGLPDTLPFGVAAGTFALGYVLGLLALFAPGGVGVREITYVGLLAPWLGQSGAVALSVASRIELTLTEIAAPLAVLALLGLRRPHAPEEPVDAARSGR